MRELYRSVMRRRAAFASSSARYYQRMRGHWARLYRSPTVLNARAYVRRNPYGVAAASLAAGAGLAGAYVLGRNASRRAQPYVRLNRRQTEVVHAALGMYLKGDVPGAYRRFMDAAVHIGELGYYIDQKELADLLMCIESDDFRQAKKIADRLFYHHPEFGPYYKVILGMIYDVLGYKEEAAALFDEFHASDLDADNKDHLVLSEYAKCQDPKITGTWRRVTSYLGYGPSSVIYDSLQQFMRNYDYLYGMPETEDLDILAFREFTIDHSVRNSRVTVRAWLPTNPLQVGHVSVHTDLVYASFWPEEGVEADSSSLNWLQRCTFYIQGLVKTKVKKKEHLGGRNFLNIYSDFLHEKRFPEVRYTFYRPARSVKRLDETFDNFVSNKAIKWGLLGSSKSIFAYIAKGEVENCTSLAVRLLDCLNLGPDLIVPGELKSYSFPEIDAHSLWKSLSAAAEKAGLTDHFKARLTDHLSGETLYLMGNLFLASVATLSSIFLYKLRGELFIETPSTLSDRLCINHNYELEKLKNLYGIHLRRKSVLAGTKFDLDLSSNVAAIDKEDKSGQQHVKHNFWNGQSSTSVKPTPPQVDADYINGLAEIAKYYSDNNLPPEEMLDAFEKFKQEHQRSYEQVFVQPRDIGLPHLDDPIHQFIFSSS